MIVFRADLFQAMGSFVKHAGKLKRKVNSSAPASGFEEVLVPGDLEARARRKRKNDGIPVPKEVWDSISDVAEQLSVDLPDFD